VASFLLPPAAYLLARPYVSSDAAALAIGALFPAAWTVLRLIVRRRLEPLGAISLSALSVALLIALLSGGNSLLLKLQEAPLTGALGLAMLVSVVVRRPLLTELLRIAGRQISIPFARARFITAIFGATLVAEALVRLGLALTLDTSTFVEVHRPVSWAIWGIGLLLLLGTRGRTNREQQ